MDFTVDVDFEKNAFTVSKHALNSASYFHFLYGEHWFRKKIAKIIFQYVFQLATRAYVFHTLTTRILSERWPSYYFSIIPIILFLHALVIGLGTKKEGENDSKLLASTKIMVYDLDDNQAVSQVLIFFLERNLNSSLG